MTKKIAIIGAGFSGAVVAHQLAQTGMFSIDVFDSRSHVAGNCHTQRDLATGVMAHVYGPHIFHTSNKQVWDFVNQFDEFVPYINRVKAFARGRVFSLPINLLTINQLFNRQFSPSEAQAYLASLSQSQGYEPQTFEEQALHFVGQEIYETFFKGYTLKQWGVEPSELPASILKRLPVRFNYDDNYYASSYQGIPKHGYTALIENMLDSSAITVQLSTRFDRSLKADYAHVFYSGPIDAWFGYELGRLGYRTLDFEQIRADGDYQGNAVINYCDADVPWTRIAEHKHFAPWETHDKTLVCREYSRFCGDDDIPYYPIRLVKDKSLLQRYVELAKQESAVSFIGRLGTYRYLDMHVTIAEALAVAESFVLAQANHASMPAFAVDVLA